MQYGIDAHSKTLVGHPVKGVGDFCTNNPVIPVTGIPVIDKYYIIIFSFIMASFKLGGNTVLSPSFEKNILIIVPALFQKHGTFILSFFTDCRSFRLFLLNVQLFRAPETYILPPSNRYVWMEG
ncbi:MAG: hypothetical protein MZV63_45915 [Marinilabiliales bacterium]|nr:hypothetical protein [Marinilabiliales bacterium]